MEFYMLFFFFFLNIRTIYQNLFFIQNLFPFFMQSHIFSCLYTIQVCKFYVPLSSFFYFFILFKFPIWITIPIIKKTTKKIYFLTYSHFENKRPVEKISHLESL